jgi:hypothetical protein
MLMKIYRNIFIDILILKIEVKIDKFEYYALFVFYKLDC